MSAPTLADARATLQRCFGYPAFRSGQERAVSSVLSGRDTLVVLPTGGGKSLCYQVPALLLDGLTVVVSPLISLMKDQVDALTARNLPAAFINSSLSSEEVSERLRRARCGELKLLYVAPERFDAGGTATRLREIGVSLLAIDEAHCISEWGHDFRPSYTRMSAVRELLGNPPTIALTATATPAVRKDIVKHVALRDPEIIITGFDRTNLRYHVIPAKREADKEEALVSTLHRVKGLAIVYASTRRSVEHIATMLARSRIGGAMAYHAGLEDNQRRDVQDAFMKESVRAIVATNAFGMGIDKPNVRLVVHHAMPGTLEAYYQEAGRAGRDGEMSDCVLLHSFRDRFTHEFFIRSAYPKRKLVEQIYGAAIALARQGQPVADSSILAARAGKDTSERAAASALRLLTAAGVIESRSSGDWIEVTLIATPERVRRDLSGAEHLEMRNLLRSLWRLQGKRLFEGTLVESAALAADCGSVRRAIRILEQLAARQFVLYRKRDGDAASVKEMRPGELPIDWARLERRRRAELAKLDAMQGYAYTTSCRRAFLLRYFGDPAARARCDGCDRCTRSPLIDGLSEKAGDSRQSRSSRSRENRKGRRDRTIEAAASSAQPNPLLVEELRQLRTRIAREQKVPAYMVFPDRTLADLAAAKPQSPIALEAVHGMGPLRIEKYGERVLALIRRLAGTRHA